MDYSKGTIFINYRRDDSGWNTVALYNELQEYFSKDQIFKDFNAINPGDDFVESIHEALQDCDVLLVIIGKTWLSMKGESGMRRLDEPDDFVRLEIAKALERKIKVIPVLFDDAVMPREEDLPPGLAALCRRQFIKIESTRFEDDVRKLAEAIGHILGQPVELTGRGHAGGRGNDAGSSRVKQDFFDSGNTGTGDGKDTGNGGGTGSGTGPGIPPPKPENYLIISIIVTIVCCFIFGIPAIIAANKVDALYAQGKYAEANEKSAAAKKWAIISACTSLVLWIIYIILYSIGVDNLNNTGRSY